MILLLLAFFLIGPKTAHAAGDPCQQGMPFAKLEQAISTADPVLSEAESDLTDRQILTIRQLTTIFENGTTDFQYAYIEDNKDGGGPTVGEAGFTGHELLALVRNYLKAPGANPRIQQEFKPYLPCLRRFAHRKDLDHYGCLFPSLTPKQMSTDAFKVQGGIISKKDFGKVWVDAAGDPVMRHVQDERVKNSYLKPALQTARHWGLRSALGAAIIYDTCIQQGGGGARTIARRVRSRFARTHQGRKAPNGQAEEVEWLKLFLAQRKIELSKDPIGASTTPREDSLSQILDARNLDLKLPFHITYFNHHFELK